MSVADEHEADFYAALGAGDPQAKRIWMEMIEKQVNPPVVLETGYCIPDLRPGAVVHWRPLGRNERPLARLAAFEEGMRA